MTPEHSPPPSPSKATPRHGQLESETLKHSLHHAHRMIQQLKNNIHREKTEKIELKRMLQDARDELESNRSANGLGSAKKGKKNDKDVFKKPARPDRLGALRTPGQEITMDDDDWEEQDALQNTPSRRPRQAEAVPGAFPSGFSSAAETSANEGFETAYDNDTSDAFETANEREGNQTETDAFQTGVETLDGDSASDLTETEGGPVISTVRQKPSSLAFDYRNAYESTASTSGDDSDGMDVKTPIQAQHPRYRLKLRQGGYRRSTPRLNEDMFENTPPAAKDSPASFASNSNNSTPAQGKSLFAELGSFSESEDGSTADGTPSRSSLLSPDSSPEGVMKPSTSRSPLQSFGLLKPVMVSSGMMTEPWSPAASTLLDMSSISSQDTKPASPIVPALSVSSLFSQGTTPQSPAPTVLHISAVSTQGTEPVAPVIEKMDMSSIVHQTTSPREPLIEKVVLPSLNVSSITHQTTEPRDAVVEKIVPPSLNVSIIAHQATVPRDPVVEQITPPSLNLSAIAHQATVPRDQVVEKTIPPSLNLSTIAHQSTVPRDPVVPIVQLVIPPSFNMSSIVHQTTEPQEPHMSRDISCVPLVMSSISTQGTEPVEPSRATSDAQLSRATPLLVSSLSHQETEPTVSQNVAPLQFSSVFSQATEPVELPKLAPLQFSSLLSQTTEPVELPKPAVLQMSVFSSQSTQPVESPRPAPSQFSLLSCQTTEPIVVPQPTLSRIAMLSSQTTEPVEPPRHKLSHISAITVHNTQPIEPLVAPRPEHRLSNVKVLQDTQPESPTLPAFLPSPSRPSTANRIPAITLNFSPIWSQETEPQTPSRPVTAQRSVPVMLSTSGAFAQTDDQKTEAGVVGYFGAAPWNKSGSQESSIVNGDGRMPLGPISANGLQTDRTLNSQSPSPVKQSRSPMTDEGTQTMVSADQIDKLLAARSQRSSGTPATAGIDRRVSPPASPRRMSNDAMRVPRRPGSSSSVRSRGGSPPPLPPDHKQVIAAAALKTPPLPGLSPTTPGAMGPPAIPASAYKKRPQTPTIKTNMGVSSPKTGGTTPRARYSSQRGESARSGASSPVTRRSSVSSFGSEIDHRFNEVMPFGQNSFDPNTTDPRMIQAITQTMIGEFLWKYTRKAGREGMSENRHRRFFWIHPYTRTLYWSEQDPATAGRAQLKAKSVSIETVQEVTDDNTFPPGLHHKSLVIVTPGRTIKFTAPTSQRHETWFNALSYLLRPEGHQQEEDEVDEIQDEFNGGGFRSTSRQTARSRVGSYMSGRSSPHHAQIPTLRHSTVTQHQASSTELRQGSMSRLSNFIRPSSGLRGSFSTRRSQPFSTTDTLSEKAEVQPQSNDDLTRRIVEASHRDEFRLEMENVRACCDGKHDVAHLHMHSVKDRQKSHHSNSGPSVPASMSSRSHSRASGRNSQAGGH